MGEVNSVDAITIRLVTDKPVKKTPYQVKGVFMKQFPDTTAIPMLNGTYRDKFLYPRIQVKILNEQIYIVGVNEGVKPVRELIKLFNLLDFGNITFNVLDIDVEDSENRMQYMEQLVRYRFITPWVALNKASQKRYKYLKNDDRLTFLNRLLGQNLIFLAREIGLDLSEKVYTKLKLTSLFPKPIDENSWGAFTGEFQTNFILPNYIGIGNGITRGYGVIYGLYNPQDFQFDEGILLNSNTKSAPVDISKDDKALDEIDASTIPLAKRKPKKKARPLKTKTKKVLSEEFDIEEVPMRISEPSPKRKSRPTKNHKSKPKKKPIAKKKTQKKKQLPSDGNFNTAEFHQKQHKLK